MKILLEDFVILVKALQVLTKTNSKLGKFTRFNDDTTYNFYETLVDLCSEEDNRDQIDEDLSYFIWDYGLIKGYVDGRDAVYLNGNYCAPLTIEELYLYLQRDFSYLNNDLPAQIDWD